MNSISYFDDHDEIKYMYFSDDIDNPEKIKVKDNVIQQRQKYKDSKNMENRQAGKMVDHASPYINIRETVRSKMIHGPHKFECGNTGRFHCIDNFNDIKMLCTRGFHKEFCSNTTITDNEYLIYRRYNESDAPASATTVEKMES